jgi:MFS family permease
LWLGVVSLLNDAASEMIYPLLPYFLVGTLGAGPAVLGVIEGVAESAASFLKLGSGWLSDRVRRRKPLLAWGYGLATVARPVIALATAPWQVLGLRFLDRIGKGIRAAPRDALLAESVVPERRGMAFGFHRAADHAGAVIGPLLATAVLLAFPGHYRLVFLLALVPGLVSLLAIAFRVRETAGRGSGPAEPGGVVFEPRLRGFLLVLGLFTLGNATDAFLLLRAQSLGVPLAAIPLLWGVHHVSKVFWNVAGGALADRIGARRAIAAGWLCYALTYLGFALAGEAWQVWLLFLFYGLYYGLTEAPEKVLVARLAPANRRGGAFGAYHFAIGVAALPASVIFGAVWGAYGARAAFLLGGGLALAAALLLPVVVRESARVEA